MATLGAIRWNGELARAEGPSPGAAFSYAQQPPFFFLLDLFVFFAGTATSFVCAAAGTRCTAGKVMGMADWYATIDGAA